MSGQDDTAAAPAASVAASAPPGPEVLAAFGLTGTPVRLPGGEGRSVRAGDTVLKPADPDPEIARRLAETMDSMADADADRFRVSRPLRASDACQPQQPVHVLGREER